MASPPSPKTRSCVDVRQEIITLQGWPTDIVSVDFSADDDPHTVLVFIPGNPGCVGWYIPILIQLVEKLGPGFAARGTSYAGHSGNEKLVSCNNNSNNNNNMSTTGNRNCSIAWTVDGQIEHKCTYLNHILSEFSSSSSNFAEQQQQKTKEMKSAYPQIIFLSHSIGSHMVERVLLMRPDILGRTIGVIHMMPYIRANSFPFSQKKLEFAAANPELCVAVSSWLMTFLKFLPQELVENVKQSAFDDKDGRHLAVQLLRQPTFAGNFFWLGTEEIRDVPEVVDVASLRVIGWRCQIKMLYCGQDQWGPEFHIQDLLKLRSQNHIPSKNISISYMPDLMHAFVTKEWMVTKTIDWCYNSIQDIFHQPPPSRL